MVLSLPQDASNFPSGDHATHQTVPACPASSAIKEQVPRFAGARSPDGNGGGGGSNVVSFPEEETGGGNGDDDVDEPAASAAVTVAAVTVATEIPFNTIEYPMRSRASCAAADRAPTAQKTTIGVALSVGSSEARSETLLASATLTGMCRKGLGNVGGDATSPFVRTST